MANKKLAPPSLDEIEDKLNTLGRAVFGSENFGKVMNTTMSTQARIKKGFSNQMGRRLNFYNIPSQDDVTTLAEQCARIEARMVNIESMLHQLLDEKQPVRSGPARTKQPKSAAKAEAAKPATATRKPRTKSAKAKKKT